MYLQTHSRFHCMLPRLFLFCLTFLLTGCSLLATEEPVTEHLVVPQYRFDSGDKLNITIFGQEELSGEYSVSGEGDVSLPLVGKIKAKDLTIQELEKAIIGALSPTYLLNPRVSIQVLNYRPYYILGEINNPKSYPYISGMTYLNAVAIAGGFTYRAVKSHVYVIRADDPRKKELKLRVDMPVVPGDVIRVDERFF